MNKKFSHLRIKKNINFNVKLLWKFRICIATEPNPNPNRTKPESELERIRVRFGFNSVKIFIRFGRDTNSKFPQIRNFHSTLFNKIIYLTKYFI